MIDQITLDFLDSMPKDKPTSWGVAHAPTVHIEGHTGPRKLIAFLPDAETAPASQVLTYCPETKVSDLSLVRHMRYIAGDKTVPKQWRDMDSAPKPKTLKGVLYQGWWEIFNHAYLMDVDSGGAVFFPEQHKAVDKAKQKADARYGYRTLNTETGVYGPLVIVGGADA